MAKTWKVIKKTLLFTVLGVVLLSVAAGVLTYIYQDDIKAMAIKQVNANLNARVIINGSDIDITFFSTFPDAAIEFRNFKIMEPNASTGSATDGKEHILAQAKTLDFKFSPLDFLNNQYHITRILLSEGQIHLKICENGETNYNILKPDTLKKDTAKGSPLDLKLKHIRLKNVQITYDDEQDNRHLNMKFNNASFAGSFTDAQYNMNATLDMFAANLTIGKQQYLKNRSIAIDASIMIDNKAKKYDFKEVKLKFDKAIYQAKGSVTSVEKRQLTELTISGEDAGIQTLISLLPSNISALFKDYQSNGQINFAGHIHGYLSKNELPSIDFKFGIINGTIHDSKHSMGLDAVNLNGEYSNGKAHDLENSYIHISHFTARLNGRPINIQYTMDNFEDPMVNAVLKADINLKDLRNFVTIPDIDTLTGDLNLDASFKGKIVDLKRYSTINKTSLNGKMQIKNVTLKPTNQKSAYKNMSGDFETNGNDLEVTNFSGLCGHSDFTLNGSFKNLASFLFLPNQPLNANSDLKCHYLNIDDFLLKSGSNTTSSDDKHFNLPAFLYFTFSIEADKLIFGKFVADNVTGNVQTTKSQVLLKNISMNTMSGTVQLNGNMMDKGAGQFAASAHIILKRIDVKQLFYEFENFGQDYITDKYINGRIDATIDYTGLWNRNLSPDTKSIVCDADVTVYDGEVNQFPPFIRLGKFLKVKSLDDIHFSEYTNKILISNRVVTIPKMDIKSNAVNVTLAGTHTFDNVMDYKLKVNMTQLIFGAKKDYEDEFGEVEVDKNGGVNVFLTMKGPASNYEIKYDTKSSIKSIGSDFKQESTEIKKIFKSNSPNAKPGEDLNKHTDEIELGTGDNETENEDVPKKHSDRSAQDSARHNAFKDFKKKLKNTK